MRMKYILLFSFIACLSIAVKAQNTIVSGTITDAQTNRPLAFVTVSFPGTSIGVNSDISGKYRLESGKPYTQLKFSFVGYKQVTRTIVAYKEQVINVKLQSDVQTLNAVT